MSIEEVIDNAVNVAVNKAMTPERATEMYVQRHEGKEADVHFVSVLLGVSKKTIYKAVEERKIKPLPRIGLSDIKFDMQYALMLKKSDLR